MGLTLVGVLGFLIGIYVGSLANRAMRSLRGTREIAVQSQTTYSWKAEHPRFSVLPDRSHG